MNWRFRFLLDLIYTCGSVPQTLPRHGLRLVTKKMAGRLSGNPVAVPTMSLQSLFCLNAFGTQSVNTSNRDFVGGGTYVHRSLRLINVDSKKAQRSQETVNCSLTII